MIPEHVAAYAAGWRAASVHYHAAGLSTAPLSWRAIADACSILGLGRYDPDELRRAAKLWEAMHVDHRAYQKRDPPQRSRKPAN